MNIACVLRSSAHFNPDHVVWLKKQCDVHIPHDRFIVYTDTPVFGDGIENRPLESNWPKWWAKMEIYGDEELRGSTLILDLDTVILGRFEPDRVQQLHSWVMRHFTRDGFQAQESFACGIMMVTDEFRKEVYEHFSQDPQKYMDESRGDDQHYFMKYFGKKLRRFQDEWIDAFVSFKLHVLQHGIREDNVFVNFHGEPRPWDVNLPWVPRC